MPQRLVLEPLFFFIYMNNLPQGLNSDDISLFSILNCGNTSALTLNSGLLKMQDWAYQWKMLFNSGRDKKKATMHPPLLFNNSEINLSSNQKHLGLALNSKLLFNEHINDRVHQTSKDVQLRKMQTILPCTSLLTIYELFIRHLDHAYVIYDQSSNASFSKNIEWV